MSELTAAAAGTDVALCRAVYQLRSPEAAHAADIDRTEARLVEASQAGSADAALRLGSLLEKECGNLEEAAHAYREAERRGIASAGWRLGRVLEQLGREADAEAAYRRAEQKGLSLAGVALGDMLRRRGDLAGALALYQRAADRGASYVATRLGDLWRLSDPDRALGFYLQAAEKGDAAAMPTPARCCWSGVTSRPPVGSPVRRPSASRPAEEHRPPCRSRTRRHWSWGRRRARRDSTTCKRRAGSSPSCSGGRGRSQTRSASISTRR